MDLPAKAECPIDYRPPALTTALTVWAALLPVFAVPVGLGFFFIFLVSVTSLLNGTLWAESGLTIMASVSICFLFLAIVAVALLSITAILADDRIVLTRNGLCFPLFLSGPLRLRRMRSWSDLRQIHYAASSEGKPGVLLLSFHSGGSLKLRTSAIAKPQLESFLVACEVCHPDVSVTSELSTFRQTLSDASKEENLSFTKLWDMEFENHFGATAFVPLAPGQSLRKDSLRIVRQLAFGGLSAVYLAQQYGRDLVVVKESVLLSNIKEEKRCKAVEMFQREFRLLRSIDHPQIAHVLDFFTEAERNYQVLEYIPGRTLRQIIAQEGPLSEGTVLGWARELCGILAHLHGGKPPILHRDLTPENIILSDQSGEAKIVLIDFGAANQFIGTATGTIVGKQEFMSPEQFRGKPTPASDLYSLGATMHLLLTGVNPRALQSSHPRTVNPGVSEATDMLVAALTEQNVDKRPSQAAEVIAAIDTILSLSQQSLVAKEQSTALQRLTQSVAGSSGRTTSSDI